jgi:hypothetical protein
MNGANNGKMQTTIFASVFQGAANWFADRNEPTPNKTTTGNTAMSGTAGARINVNHGTAEHSKRHRIKKTPTKVTGGAKREIVASMANVQPNDFFPVQISLVMSQPNAGAHLLPEAGARHERTLEAVRCSA